MHGTRFNSFMALILFGLTALPVQAAPMVTLNLLDSDIDVGERFEVEVLVDGDGIGLDLLSFGFDVNTTGSVFTFDDHTVGPGFDDDSLFIPPDVGGSAFPGIADDDVLLATLSLTATSLGTGSLQVLGLADNLFSGLAYEIDPVIPDWHDINATIDITVNANPVPEPATLLLAGIGLIGLFRFRYKLNGPV